MNRGSRLTFVVAGPQRTGTSWLDMALRTHPALQLPRLTKETFYFDRDYSPDLAQYFQRYFPEVEDGRLLGEVSPTYFHDTAARARLRDAFPDLRVVILVRDPIERTYSLFRHEVAKGRSPDDLVRAIEANPAIVESGRYATHCPLWMATFGERNVLLIDNRQIASAPDSVMHTLCSFLDIAPRTLPEALKVPIGEGQVPRFPRLAKVAAAAALALRRQHMDRVVEWAKALGLKRVYRGGDLRRLTMSDAERSLLSSVHAADVDFFEHFAAAGTRPQPVSGGQR